MTRKLDWIDIIEAVPAIAAFYDRIGARVFSPLPAMPVVPKAEFDEMARAATLMMSAQARLAKAIVTTKGQQALIDLLTFPIEWVGFINWDKLIDPQHRICRIDLARTTLGPKFMEFNVFCGVGGPDVHTPYAHVLDCHKHRNLTSGTSPFVYLADYYAGLMHQHGLNRIALVDWSTHGSQGYPDFSELRRHLSARLPDVPIDEYDEHSYPAAWLRPGGGADVLLHRVFTGGDLDGDLGFLTALRDSGAHFSSGLEAELCMDKGWLALLWEAKDTDVLTAEESAAVRTYLPPSRMLDDASLDDALDHKDHLVFKARGSYGGDGVFIGADCDRKTLARKLRQRGPGQFIAQELLSTIMEHAPLTTGDPAIPVEVVFGLYHYAGQTAGLMVRATSGSRIVNSSTGAKTGWSVQTNDETGPNSAI